MPNKNLESEEEIKQVFNSIAEDVDKCVRKIKSEKLTLILDLYIFGFDKKDDSKKNKEKILLTDDIDIDEFERYKYRVGTFVLLTQIIFYSILQKFDREKASPVYNLPSLSSSLSINDIISYFKQDFSSNYESIFQLDILSLLIEENIDCYNSLKQLAELLSVINHDLIIKYDIIGKLYHSLIPFSLRKTIAAFYTKYPIARFVLEFVITKKVGAVMDPTCGSGTFLISAYQKMVELEPTVNHDVVLKNIYGNDITSFAVLLATVNLSLQDIDKATNHCFVSKGDIFDLRSRAYSIDDYLNEKETSTISLKESKNISGYKIPKISYLVGNPPFTRGERLPVSYTNKLRGYFEIIKKKDFLTKNMPLHGYILLDMERFLQKKGRVGLVLPLTTLYIQKLEKTRKFLLKNYRVEYIITSEVESFSEDTDQKEIILIAQRTVEEQLNYDIKFIILKQELTKNSFKTIAESIKSISQDVENASFSLKMVNSKKLLEDFNDDWTIFLEKGDMINSYNLIKNNDFIGYIKDIEVGGVEAFRGFRQDAAKYWMIPNSDWDISKIEPDYIEIVNTIDKETTLRIKSEFFITGLLSSEHYRRPIIESVNSFILKNNGQEQVRDVNLKKYCEYLKSRLKPKKYDQFFKQLIKIGKRFDYKGRIAFPHRFDVTSGSVLCFNGPDYINLSQNWFSIKGLKSDYEKLLVAWFNSSLFLLSYLISRRQQRGPFGQTAVGQLKKYLIPLPDSLSAQNIEEIYNAFKNLNTAPLLNFSIEEQIKLTKSNDNERRKLDLIFMKLLKIHNNDLDKQKTFLIKLYILFENEIENMKKQKTK